MKLFALNVLVAITMLFNAFGITGQPKPGEIRTQAASSEAGIAIVPNVPVQVSQTGLGAYPPPGGQTPTPPGPEATLSPEPIATPVPSVTSTPDPNEKGNHEKYDFKISFKYAYLKKSHGITLKYDINEIFADSNSGGFQLSINILGDQPIEITRIPVWGLEGEVKLTIDQGCYNGCTVGVNLMLIDGSVVASDQAVISKAETFTVNKNGGEIQTADGKITVKVGEKALKQDTNVYILENTLDDGIPSGSVIHPFIIDAEAVSNGQEINTFDEPIQLIYSYDDGEFIDPGRWSFVSYNEDTNQWEVLPTSVDAKNNQLVGLTTHFSDKALDYNAIDKFKFDDLLAAQVSLFTGAAAYSYPISVPSGPGGLTPSISLSYNSNGVDGIGPYTQASWVGMGWNLDVGSISRNTIGTDVLDDDTFSLSVNGAGGTLIPFQTGTDNGNAYTDYLLQNDNFWRIRHYTPARATLPSTYKNSTNGSVTGDVSKWVAWDTAGNKYTFDDRFYYGNVNVNPAYAEVSKWCLSSIENIFGKRITFSYAKPTPPTYKINSVNTRSSASDTEMYLDTITYANQYQIIFNRADRNDNDPNACNDHTEVCAIDYKRLDNIVIKGSAIGNGVYDTTIRTYQLIFNNNDNSVYVFPGVTWPTNSNTGRTLTLTSIIEKGSSNGALPSTTFAYADGMHLSSVSNGYNGKVEFIYEHQNGNDNQSIPWTNPTTLTNSSYANNLVGCSGFDRYRTPRGDRCTDNGITFGSENNPLSFSLLRPGGVINFVSDIANSRSGNSVVFGVTYNNIAYTSPPITLNTDGQRHVYTYNLTIPINITISPNKLSFDVYENTPYAVEFYTFNVGNAITRYRVVEKHLYANAASQTYQRITYQYNNPAILDEAHSDLAGTGNFKTELTINKPYSQFMGHYMVREIRPVLREANNNIISDGGYTDTYFNQIGIAAGRIEDVKNYDSSGNLLSETKSNYSSNYTVTTASAAPYNCGYWMRFITPTNCVDNIIYYYTLDSTESRTYVTGSQVNFIGTKTSMTYGPRDGYYVPTYIKTTNSEFSSDNQNGTPLNGIYTKYLSRTGDAYYQESLPEITALCADPSPSQMSASNYFASCGTIQSNYLGQTVNMYQANSNQNYVLTEVFKLLDFVTKNTAVTNGNYIQTDDNTNQWYNESLSASKFYYDANGNIWKTEIGGKKWHVDLGSGSNNVNYHTGSIKCYGDSASNSSCTGDSRNGIFLLWEETALGQRTSYDYDRTKQLLKKTVNPNGQLITDGSQNATLTGYDEFGRIWKIAQPGDYLDVPTMEIDYGDVTGHPVIPITVSGVSFSNPYYTEISGIRPMSGLPALALEKRNFYDGLGNLIAIEMPGIAVGTSTLDVYNHTLYDFAGRPVRTSVPDSFALGTTNPTLADASTDVQTTFDALGNKIKVTGTDGTTTGYSYSVDIANHHLVQQTTDAKNQVTTTYSDAWGNVRTVVLADGTTQSTYLYDKLNRMVTYTQAGADGQISYDVGGRKTQTTDPNTGTWIYTYDAYNDLLTQTDARSCITTLGYDILNRLTSKAFSNCLASGVTTLNVTYTYDNTANGNLGIGRRTAMQVGSTSDHNLSSWTYDSRGRMLSEAKTTPDGHTYNTFWAYNSADQVTSMVYPNGEAVDYGYNLLGQVNSVFTDSWNSINFLTGATYDAAGRTVELDFGNNTITKYTYNPWTTDGGRLQKLQSGVPDSFISPSVPNLQGLTYTYDPNGNIKTIEDAQNSNQKQCFVYDSVNRLTHATTNNDTTLGCAANGYNGNYDETYAYDPGSGNLSSKSSVGTYVYSAGHPHQVTRMSTDTTDKYTYDANGNMISRVTSTGTFAMKYDAENRMVEVTKNNALFAGYAYDGDGNRVLTLDYKVSLNNPDKTIYIGNYLEVFIDASYTPPAPQPVCTGCTHKAYIAMVMNQTDGPQPGQIWRSYYYSGSTRLAMKVVDAAGGSTSGLTWLYGDLLGSTSVTADANGVMFSTMLYKAWGEIRYNNKDDLNLPQNQRNDTPTNRRYTGQYQEAGLGGTDGLLFYNARWFDPYINRWVQPDSIIPDIYNPLDLDRYQYVRSNPVNFNDPTGHCIGPFILICIPVAAWIIAHATVITAAIVATAIIVPWVTSDTPQGGGVKETPEQAIGNGLAVGTTILTFGEGILAFGQTYYVTPKKATPEPGGKSNLNLPFKDPALSNQVQNVVDTIDDTGVPPIGVRQGGDGIFKNSRNDLPNIPNKTNYIESDVWPGLGQRGQLRIVMIQKGEVYFTNQHYASGSFARIR